MICPSCKTKNQYYHRYCYYCGHKLDTHKITLETEKSEKTQDFIQSEDAIQAEAETLYNQPQSPEIETLEEPLYSEIDNEAPKNENTENLEENTDFDNLISESQQSIYNYLFDDKIDDFDITREIPLRRYRKDRASKKANKLSRLLISVFAVFLLAFASFILLKGLGNNPSKQANNPQAIVVSTVVKPTEKDGKPAHQIVFNTTNGKEVKILDTIIPVKDGRAELVLEDSFLYTLNPIENEDGFIEM